MGCRLRAEGRSWEGRLEDRRHQGRLGVGGKGQGEEQREEG